MTERGRPIPVPEKQRREEWPKFMRAHDWPRYPWMPLKRYREGESWFEAGCLLAAHLDAPIVYGVNLWDIGKYAQQARDATQKAVVTVGDLLPYLPILQTYESLEAMQIDGWMGD